MEISFDKYQGTGNDFIIIDNRQQIFPKNNTKLIAQMCSRQFGIGADGLMLLEEEENTDFRMVYFNADGREGSMCGNGGRCMVAFARSLGIIDSDASFEAADGRHFAHIDENGVVKLMMQPVEHIRQKPKYLFLDTGSPHHVQMVEDLENFDVQHEGKRLRFGLYGEAGCNINFVESGKSGQYSVRTYERGVEAETLSCGTGVTATALAMHHSGNTALNHIRIKTRGGDLDVSFEHIDGKYQNVSLKGAATFVFSGKYTI